ncbi:uncharacterized protein LOC141594024 [Silene latifolia]|uniref:uncharacterized protein LOC141594024 n=1 Tax=Silene latifolia TaxID=37657 RepID=UPI003D76F884
MRNAIRCCISCILPCGALDVIRIVHVNGRVEEITGTIYASEVMKAHPKHILKKPTTKPISDEYIETVSAHHRPTIVVVPPDALLQRGKIYFLIPVSDPATCSSKRRRKKKKELDELELKKVGPPGNNNSNSNYRRIDNNNNNNDGDGNCINNGIMGSLSKDDDKYLSEILSEKVSSQRDKRRGRVAVWRPHLESITETFYDN